MPCFCATNMMRLPAMAPKVSLSDVAPVPPQLAMLADLLGLEAMAASGPVAMRADMKMNAALPDMTGAAWMNATLGAPLPLSGGPVLSLVMRLAAAGMIFPLLDPKKLILQIKQAVASLMAQAMQALAPFQAIPPMQLQNMTLAARLTLQLRAQGLCPMALARVDPSFSAALSLGDPGVRLQQAARFSASLKVQPLAMQPFALPPAKLNLAMSMAAFAPLASAPAAMGLPPVTEPDFMKMAVNMIKAVAALPMMALDALGLLDAAAKLDSIGVIQEAFGMDALTPAGVARVNAMLAYVASLRIALPNPATLLMSQLGDLPDLENVRLGAATAKAAAPVMSASMSMKPPTLAALPLLEAMAALNAVLSQLLGQSPLGACGSCQFKIPA